MSAKFECLCQENFVIRLSMGIEVENFYVNHRHVYDVNGSWFHYLFVKFHSQGCHIEVYGLSQQIWPETGMISFEKNHLIVDHGSHMVRLFHI